MRYMQESATGLILHRCQRPEVMAHRRSVRIYTGLQVAIVSRLVVYKCNYINMMYWFVASGLVPRRCSRKWPDLAYTTTVPRKSVSRGSQPERGLYISSRPRDDVHWVVLPLAQSCK